MRTQLDDYIYIGKKIQSQNCELGTKFGEICCICCGVCDEEAEGLVYWVGYGDVLVRAPVIFGEQDRGVDRADEGLGRRWRGDDATTCPFTGVWGGRSAKCGVSNGCVGHGGIQGCQWGGQPVIGHPDCFGEVGLEVVG